jgi:N6-L-threonylcarbamoyladenine synthase
MKKPFLVLGLESSCDETSAALIADGRIIASRVYTQEIHSQYGGVVPEIASRAHLQKIDRLCQAVLDEAHVPLTDINLIAVTDRPGLAGALLVGISFGLGLSVRLNVPITGINHLEGHIASVTLENPALTFPFLALVVSGGHTALYTVKDFGAYELLGKTVDDAAGEAFDKVGKLVGFAYPAGRAIESEATLYAKEDLIAFTLPKISTEGLNFSFSGLKTAVKNHCHKLGEEDLPVERPRICKSFQNAVIRSLVHNTLIASERTGIRRIAAVGGVACNNALRNALRTHFGQDAFFPSPGLCLDNAAMIAKAGWENYCRGRIQKPSMNPSGEL